jgi:hypothetical protein
MSRASNTNHRARCGGQFGGELDGTKQVAQRMVNGENRFVQFVMERGFTRDEATHIMSVYRKARVLKIDAVLGQFEVKHGAFLDPAVLRNAVAAPGL